MKTLLSAAALALLLSRPALAGPDPKATVDGLDNALLDVMKNADKLGYKGRYEKLKPVLEQSFNLPLMARISVGPQWTSLSPEQQKRVVDAFEALSVATYAARFDGFGGEQFKIVSNGPITGGDELVNTQMVRPKDEPVDLNYRLRQENGDWKVIDVFLSGTISQLANYRSEFATTLRTKGPDALVTLIDQKVSELTPKG